MASLSEFAEDNTWADPATSPAQRQGPENHPEQRGLSNTVRSEDPEAFAPAYFEVDGAELPLTPAHERGVQSRDGVAASGRSRELETKLPWLEWFLYSS